MQLKVYRGFANDDEFVIMGHVFAKKSIDDFALEGNWIKNTWEIIQIFNLDTVGGVHLQLNFLNSTYTTTSVEDGFFEFKFPYSETLEYGWHSFEVMVVNEDHSLSHRAKGDLLKQHNEGLAFISDIDDTLLVSHTVGKLKKLWILLTRNISRRKYFPNVVEHYTNLFNETKQNPFFYVSSSEWNLYNLIDHFAALNDFPKGILLLKEIKTSLFDFFQTGRGDHRHKYDKIERLINFYPGLKFTLLGDDSQQDSQIYLEISEKFTNHIKAVYIRQTGSSKKAEIAENMNKISQLPIETFYFEDSADALKHSTEIGLVQKPEEKI